MSIRSEIIAKLDVNCDIDYPLYDQLKKCLILDKKYPFQNINAIDEWFKGCIKSLFYSPNKLGCV